MDIRSLPKPAETALPIFRASPAVVSKLFFGFGLSTAGLYYLSMGKKSQDLQKMLLGAALVLAALFFF